jgi:hypothetical protein
VINWAGRKVAGFSCRCACLSREAAIGHDAFMSAKPLLLVVHHNSMAKINARIAEGNKLAALFAFTVRKMRDQLTARPAELPRCWGCNRQLPGMNDIGAFGMVMDSTVPARLPNIASISELPQPPLLCLCHGCAGPDDDSADKVFRAFGTQIALMVSPAEGTA